VCASDRRTCIDRPSRIPALSHYSSLFSHSSPPLCSFFTLLLSLFLTRFLPQFPTLSHSLSLSLSFLLYNTCMYPIYNTRDSNIPTDTLPSMPPETFASAIVQLSGLDEYLGQVSELAGGLPPAPLVFSLADEWSAPMPTQVSIAAPIQCHCALCCLSLSIGVPCGSVFVCVCVCVCVCDDAVHCFVLVWPFVLWLVCVCNFLWLVCVCRCVCMCMMTLCIVLS